MSAGQLHCIGFDFREISRGIESLDTNCWDQDKNAYAIALRMAGSENCVQLLDLPIDEILSVPTGPTVILGVCISSTVLELIKRKFGKPKSAFITGQDLMQRGWQFRGYDIADVDGFFSVFGIDNLWKELGLPYELIQNITVAEEASRAADHVVPTHAPFHPFGIFTIVIRGQIGP